MNEKDQNKNYFQGFNKKYQKNDFDKKDFHLRDTYDQMKDVEEAEQKND